MNLRTHTKKEQQQQKQKESMMMHACKYSTRVGRDKSSFALRSLFKKYIYKVALMLFRYLFTKHLEVLLKYVWL